MSQPTSQQLTKEFLAERDARIFQMKKTGLSNSEIGKRMNMTASAVAAATKRQLKKLNSEAWLDYPEILRLELERLDELQKGLWPLTQFRREELDDGSVVVVDPDTDAVAKVLSIMQQRAKLLGMNVERSQVEIIGTPSAVDARSSLAGAIEATSHEEDSKDEAMRLLEIMGETGVLDSDVISGIMSGMNATPELEPVRDTIDDSEVVDAEIIEQED